MEFTVDLQPEEYSRVINRLANLLVAAARMVKQEGNLPLARAVVEHTSFILDDYDDDVAEFVLITIPADPSAFSPPFSEDIPF